jgi:hypothetical protein
MAMEPCSSFSFSFAPTLWGIKNYFSQLHEIVTIFTLVARLNFELSCNKGLVRAITFVFFLCSGLKGILPNSLSFHFPLCACVCVCFSWGFGLLKKSPILCVWHIHFFNDTSQRTQSHLTPLQKQNNIFWTKREMIILCNVHLAHVWACVCVYKKQESFIFQWHFAKETSNSISYCKEINLHFIITFLHEKRAEPLALVHIGRNSRFQASHIQGRPWQFIPFHHLSPIQSMLSSSKSIPCYEISFKASKVSFPPTPKLGPRFLNLTSNSYPRPFFIAPNKSSKSQELFTSSSAPTPTPESSSKLKR